VNSTFYAEQYWDSALFIAFCTVCPSKRQYRRGCIQAGKRKVLDDVSALLAFIELLLNKTSDAQARQALKKAALHSTISPERLDPIIQGLQRVRKDVLAGDGVAQAINAAENSVRSRESMLSTLRGLI